MSEPVEQIRLCEDCNTAFTKGVKALPQGKNGLSQHEIREIEEGLKKHPHLMPGYNLKTKDGVELLTAYCDSCGVRQPHVTFYTYYTGSIDLPRLETIAGLKVKRLGKYVAVPNPDYSRPASDIVNTETCKTVDFDIKAESVNLALHNFQAGASDEGDNRDDLEGDYDGPGFYITPYCTPWKAIGPYEAEDALTDHDTLSEQIEEAAWARLHDNRKRGLKIPTVIIEARDRLSALHGKGDVWWIDGLHKGIPVDPRQAGLPFETGLSPRTRPPQKHSTTNRKPMSPSPRNWSRGENTPRAGIADPRIPQRPEPMVPPQPNVRQPAAWTWASQEMSGKATYRAIEALLEDRHGNLSASQLVTASNDLNDELRSNPSTRREVYKRAEAILTTLSPKEPSGKGLPVDRAEAKLLLWLNLFSNEDFETPQTRQHQFQAPVPVPTKPTPKPVAKRTTKPDKSTVPAHIQRLKDIAARYR